MTPAEVNDAQSRLDRAFIKAIGPRGDIAKAKYALQRGANRLSDLDI